MNKLQFLSELSSIIKNLAVVASLIVGGYWAYKTYIFQNPAFYETGTIIIGQEAESINGKISLEPLDETKRLYEIDLTVYNYSKIDDQLLNYDNLNIFFQRLENNEKKKKLEFKSLLQTNEGFFIPKEQSRKLKLLVEFPEPGTYLIEANLCEKFLIDCIFQKYIHIPKLQDKI